MSSIQHKFIEFCIESKVLRFGEFKTKAGRLSPYFFNAGLFNTGAMLSKLADFYARTLIKAMEEGRIECDMIFGPAYKGITLAAAVAMRMAELGYDLPFVYNRKEVKDHGEGGNTVGAPIKGHVVIIDDVISAGTSVGESVKIIEASFGRSFSAGPHGMCGNSRKSGRPFRYRRCQGTLCHAGGCNRRPFRLDVFPQRNQRSRTFRLSRSDFRISS